MKLSHTVWSFAAASVLASTAVAQTIAKPDGQWRGSLGFGLSSTSGNSSTSSFSGSADAVVQTAINKINLYAQGLYGRETIDGKTQTTAQQYRVGGRHERNFDERIFGFAALDSEGNKPADVRMRLAPNLGVGYHVVKKPDTSFDVFTGLGYDKTRSYSGADTNAWEALLGEESSHKLAATASFKQRLVVYPSLTDGGEYRAAFDAGLVAAVGGGWNLTLTFSDRYNSNPNPGFKENDSTLLAGLQYAWGPK